ncbi:hypothetical protein BH09BAC6_BH09BAC6_29400 [soil metagenome]
MPKPTFGDSMDKANRSRKYFICTFLITGCLMVACNRQSEYTKTKQLLETVKGIRFTEVKRTFNNGVSFSAQGYRLVPSWRLSFPSADSVNIYNPKRKVFVNAPVVFDHDSIFNVAWAWLRLKKLSKDSLKFQVLMVKDRVVVDQKPNVFITFYADDYIRNVLHTDTSKLRLPSRRDTAYIKAKVSQANLHMDSAFAAIEPVVLKSKSPLLTVTKKDVVPDDLNGAAIEDQYLSPEFDITIRKAYDDFSYSFTVWVDEKGKLVFRKSLESMEPEFKAQTLRAMKGIVDGYLNLYLNVTPGKTLGMSHSSVIILNVRGTK